MTNTFLNLTVASVSKSMSHVEPVSFCDQGCNLALVLSVKNAVASSLWRLGAVGAGCFSGTSLMKKKSNEPARHWFVPLFLQTFPGVLRADTQLKPVLRSKLLPGLHGGAPCQRGGVGWDVNIRLSTGILTKHTACFSSNYIYPTNARFALHANETSLDQHSALMNNNRAVRIISAWI